jgi:hypothetical protein
VSIQSAILIVYGAVMVTMAISTQAVTAFFTLFTKEPVNRLVPRGEKG